MTECTDCDGSSLRADEEELLHLEFDDFRFAILMSMAKNRYGEALPVEDFMEGANIKRDGVREFPERLRDCRGPYRLKALEALLAGYDAEWKLMKDYQDGVDAQVDARKRSLVDDAPDPSGERGHHGAMMFRRGREDQKKREAAFLDCRDSVLRDVSLCLHKSVRNDFMDGALACRAGRKRVADPCASYYRREAFLRGYDAERDLAGRYREGVRARRIGMSRESRRERTKCWSLDEIKMFRRGFDDEAWRERATAANCRHDEGRHGRSGQGEVATGRLDSRSHEVAEILQGDLRRHFPKFGGASAEILERGNGRECIKVVMMGTAQRAKTGIKGARRVLKRYGWTDMDVDVWVKTSGPSARVSILAILNMPEDGWPDYVFESRGRRDRKPSAKGGHVHSADGGGGLEWGPKVRVRQIGGRKRAEVRFEGEWFEVGHRPVDSPDACISSGAASLASRIFDLEAESGGKRASERETS